MTDHAYLHDRELSDDELLPGRKALSDPKNPYHTKKTAEPGKPKRSDPKPEHMSQSSRINSSR